MNKEMLINKLSTKKEHYPLSDNFMKWCGEKESRQQHPSGNKNSKNKNYIDNALEAGIEVNYSKCTPNQKWHFIESYCNILHKDETDFRFILKCPELIIWLCEALDVGINEKDINEIKSDNISRNDMGIIIWKKYSNRIVEEIKKN